MDSFSNIFHSHFKDHSETPDQFGDYKLQFLQEHQKSYKELGDLLLTKQDERSALDSSVVSLCIMKEDQEDLFDLEVEVKLRRYTSFQNGFMEHHRKVLKNSLSNFLSKNCDSINRSQGCQNFNFINNDIKSYVFNEKLFTQKQIQENKERLLSKVDEYRILKQIVQSLQKSGQRIIKDAILMAVWILKHTDHLVQSIIHQNTFCILEVEEIKVQLLNYLQNSFQIDFLESKNNQKNESSKQFEVLIQTWLYTLLIAKLGYFENDSFDVNVSLQQHLKALLKQEKRQHSVLSDSEDDEIMNIQVMSKKRKL